MADSYTDVASIRDIIATQTFQTVYGQALFDQNGQSLASPLLMQYDGLGKLHTVYPSSVASGNFSLRYPMPTWEEMDCIDGKQCAFSGGTCLADGTCACIDDATMYSFGSGSDAYCKNKRAEDMTYLQNFLPKLGISFVFLQAVLSIFFSVWVFLFRKKSIVRGAQPIFLVLISMGCLICSSSIIPLSVQGDYRYLQDNTTGELLLDQPNPDILGVDIACMASVWQFMGGFVIVFSALFAKIWREKKLMDSAMRFQRKAVVVKDVLYIMAFMLIGVVTILSAWQLIDPLKWHRDVLATDRDGFPTRSVGRCRTESSSGYAFFAALLALVLGCLLYSLYLAYITRNQKFAEGTYIATSIILIFQIMILALPVMFIVKDDTNTSYVVAAGVIFLMSSAITLLTFLPKMYELHVGDAGRNFMRSSMMRVSGLDLRTLEEASRQIRMGIAEEDVTDVGEEDATIEA